MLIRRMLGAAYALGFVAAGVIGSFVIFGLGSTNLYRYVVLWVFVAWGVVISIRRCPEDRH